MHRGHFFFELTQLFPLFQQIIFILNDHLILNHCVLERHSLIVPLAACLHYSPNISHTENWNPPVRVRPIQSRNPPRWWCGGRSWDTAKRLRIVVGTSVRRWAANQRTGRNGREPTLWRVTADKAQAGARLLQVGCDSNWNFSKGLLCLNYILQKCGQVPRSLEDSAAVVY